MSRVTKQLGGKTSGQRLAVHWDGQRVQFLWYSLQEGQEIGLPDDRRLDYQEGKGITLYKTRQETLIGQPDDGQSPRLLAAMLRAVCQQENSSTDIMLLWPDALIKCISSNFGQLEERDFAEAVRWELETTLGRPAEEYCVAWQVIGNDNCNIYVTMANFLEPICYAMKREGIRLNSVIPVSVGSVTADREASDNRPDKALDATASTTLSRTILAAHNCKSLNMLGKRQQFELLNTLGKLSVAAALVLMVGIAAVDAWQYHNTEQSLQLVDSSMDLHQGDFDKMQELQSQESIISNKVSAITVLRADSPSVYSLLVKLGTMTTEGLWLSDIEVGENKTVIVGGQASNYQKLTDYLALYDKEKTDNKPVLRKSVVTPQGISFVMEQSML